MNPSNISASEIAELKRIFGQMTKAVHDYSLILLDKNGNVLTWNKGAEKLKGYTEDEIIGQHFSIFYLPEDRQINLPQQLLSEVREKGHASFVGRRIRKNGTIFWGKVEMTAIKSEDGKVIGYTKLARELSDKPH